MLSTYQINKILKTTNSVLTKKSTEAIKKRIGDSVKNNRTLSVRQFIRYLTVVNRRTEAKYIENIYENLLMTVLKSERVFGYLVRTDAFDMTEFVKVVKAMKFVKNKHRGSNFEDFYLNNL